MVYLLSEGYLERSGLLKNNGIQKLNSYIIDDPPAESLEARLKQFLDECFAFLRAYKNGPQDFELYQSLPGSTFELIGDAYKGPFYFAITRFPSGGVAVLLERWGPHEEKEGKDLTPHCQ